MKKYLRVSLFCTLMLTLVLLVCGMTAYAEDYSVWVGTVQVTSENSADVLGDGTVYYDAATNTLTLDNAYITDTYAFSSHTINGTETDGHVTLWSKAVIYSPAPMNFVIKGECRIESNGVDSYNDYGIYCETEHPGNVEPVVFSTITGYDDNAKLIAISGDSRYESSAVSCENMQLIITNLNLECYSGGGESSMALLGTNGTIIIEDSTVYAEGGDSRNFSCGIGAAHRIETKGDSQVEAVGGNVENQNESAVTSYGVVTYGRLLVGEGSYIKACSGDSSSPGSASSIGVFAAEIEVGTNAVVEAQSKNSSIVNSDGTTKANSLGVFALLSLTFVDDTSVIRASSTCTNQDALISAIGAAEINGVETVVDVDTGEELTFDAEDSTFVDANGNAAKNIIVNDVINYKLFVGGVSVTSENKDDIFGDGTAYYDPDTQTLTLDNAEIAGYTTVDQLGSVAIYTEKKLTIKVIGINDVSTGLDDGFVDAGIYYEGPVISGGTAITIKGNSVNDVLNVYSCDSSVGTIGIATDSGDVVFRNVTANIIVGGTYSQSFGIKIGADNGDDIIVDGAVVKVEAAGVYEYDKPVSIVQSLGIVANNVSVYNCGQLSVIVGDAVAQGSGNVIGMRVLGDLSVSGKSSVNAVAGSVNQASGSSDSLSISCGVMAEGSITVDGLSTVSGTSGDTLGASVGVFGFEINLPQGVIHGNSEAQSAYVSAGIATGADIEGAAVIDNETREELVFVSDVVDSIGTFFDESNNLSSDTTAITYVEFDLWVGGVHVTSVNMNDVLGDGTVSYNESDNTLTLDNANITGSYQFTSYAQSASAVIYATMPMKILVKGESRIVSGVEGNKYDYGIYCCIEDNDSNNGTAPIYDFKIYGEDENSSLYVESKDAETSSSAINTSEINLVIENLKLIAVAGSARDVSSLLGTNASVSILNSELELSTGNAGQFNYGIGCAFDIDVYSSDIEIVTGNVEADDNAALNIGFFSLKTIDVDASSVTINIGNTESIEHGTVSAGILTAKTIITDNSVFDITCGDSDGNTDSENVSCGVFSTEGVIFEDGSGIISAKLNCDTPNATIATIYSMREVENGTVRDGVSGEVLEYDSESKTYVDANGNISQNAVATGGIILFGDYNLFVGNVVVTEENKDDIFGDLDGEGATAYYDDKTNTLYLDNANITTCLDINGDGSLVAAVARVGSLNVSLIGENRVEIENLENTPYMMIGVGAAGELNITSEKYATLEIVNCDSIEQNLALVTMAFTGNERYLDLNISGYANVTARAGDVVYMDSGVSAGVLSGGSLSVTDKASLFGYGAKALRSEESSASPDGISAGVVSEETLLVNTTGEVYGKISKSDSMAMGVFGVSGVEVVNGRLVGDATAEMAQGAISAGVVTSNTDAPENVVVYAGASEDSLSENVNYYYESSYYLATYLYDGYNIGLYTVMLPEEGLAGLGTTTAVSGNGEDEEDDDIISVFVTGYDDAIIAFASYDVNGRMIDMRYTLSSTADEFGNVSCNTLNMDGAVRVKCFMFGTDMSLAPLCEELERYI